MASSDKNKQSVAAGKREQWEKNNVDPRNREDDRQELFTKGIP
jgi:hypothetical protein